MTTPSIVKGQYFDVAVEDADELGTYIVICGLRTRSLTEQVNTSDDAIRDCDNPEDVPDRVLNVNSQQMDISGTGLYNRAQAALIRTLIGRSFNYRFIMGEPGDDLVDQGYYQGKFVLINRQVTGDDGTNATAQFAWGSDGPYAWVTSTAPVLASLTLADATADEDEEWSSTITDRTAGSTITATASDGTVLTVVGSTVSGTFATTGSKTVTLIETHPEASNSPHSSTPTVTVS